MSYDPDRFREPDEPTREEAMRDDLREEFEEKYADTISKLESQRDDAVAQYTELQNKIRTFIEDLKSNYLL